MDTPNYVKTLLAPGGKKSGSRKVWSIDLEYVWLPFFTATNVQGDTAIPKEALGAPLRLAKDKDGTVKFSKSGRPVTRVAPELSEQIKIVRENFVASLTGYAAKVASENPQGYKGEVEACHKAGEPITARAHMDIELAIRMMNQKDTADSGDKRELVETAA